MNFIFAREAQEAVKKMSWWQKFKVKVLGIKIFVGYETLEEAKAPLYLFWCKYCKHFAKDRRHGYKRLNCSFCGEVHRIGSISLKMFLAELWGILKIGWKYRRA